MVTRIASTAVGPREVRRNRATNPRAVASTDGWYQIVSTGGAATLTRTVAIDVPGFAGTEQYAARATYTTAGTSSLAVLLLGVGAHAMVVAPGEQVPLSLASRSNVAGARAAYIQWYDGAAWVSNEELTSSPTMAAWSWWLHEHTVTVPAGVTRMRVGVRLKSPPTAGQNIDATIVVVGDDGPFFDGSYSPYPELTPVWTGPANASPSILVIPDAPLVEVTPEVVDGWEVTREVRNVVHTLLNRSAPDVTLRAPGLRSGRFSMVFASEADALTAYAGLSDLQTFTISDDDVPAVQTTFVVGSPDGNDEMTMRLDDETRSVWIVEVPFSEVGT